MQTTSNAHSMHTAMALQPAGFGTFATKIWIAVFPLASIALFITQPSPLTTLALCVLASLTLATVAHEAVKDANRYDHLSAGVRLLAPVQFALLMWIAVYAGHGLAGGSIVATSIAAFVSLCGLLVAEALLSGAMLLATEHGQGTMGTSLACLISEKYAGLLGRIV